MLPGLVQKLAGMVPESLLSSNLAFVIDAAIANSGMVPVSALSKTRISSTDVEDARSEGIVPVK